MQNLVQSQTENENWVNDVPFALAILLSITDPEDISTFNDDVLEFICDLLRLRTNNDDERINSTIQAIRKYNYTESQTESQTES